MKELRRRVQGLLRIMNTWNRIGRIRRSTRIYTHNTSLQNNHNNDTVRYLVAQSWDMDKSEKCLRSP